MDLKKIRLKAHILRRIDLFPLFMPSILSEPEAKIPLFHHSMRLTNRMAAKRTVIAINCRNSNTYIYLLLFMAA